jgi:DNA polymerase-3 subunit epsilon
MDHELLLNVLMHELQHGVIICGPDAHVNLFNQAAADLFDSKNPLKTGDSLYSLCLKAPVEHALDLLKYQEQKGEKHASDTDSQVIQFMSATVNQEKFLRCRLVLLPTSSNNNCSFVIILEDVSAWYRPGNLLSMKIDEFRAPMTNLRAAVENLTEYPEMSPVMRSAFENVLVQESLNLTEAFDLLDQACKYFIQTKSHLTKMSSKVLLGFIEKQFYGSKVTFTADHDCTALVKVDSYALLLAMDFLAARIQQERNLERLSCETTCGDQFVYFDFIWSGDFLPTNIVETMLDEKLQDSVGALTLGSILHLMGGDMWSQQHDNSRSALRLALPLAEKKE